MPGHLHELTFSCYQRLPLLTNDLWRRILSENINAALGQHRFELTAFVYMPEHVHLIVRPTNNTPSIPALLKAIKRPFASRTKELLETTTSPLLKRLTTQRRPGATTFRFWQEGPGYDRNLIKGKTAQATIDYIHLNPVRRNLVERAVDWKWSSARFYFDEQTSEFGLPTITNRPSTWLDPAD